MIKIRYKKAGIILFIVSAMWHSVMGQEANTEEVFTKVKAFYDQADTYSIAFDFDFKEISTDKSMHSYSGSLKKNNDLTRLKMLDTEVVSSADNSLLINHNEKVMQYGKTPSKTLGSPVDIQQFLKNYKLLTNRTDEQYNIYELQAKKTSLQTPYAKIVLYLNKTDYRILKQELFFKNTLPFETSQGTVYKEVRLDIGFSYQDIEEVSDTTNIATYLQFTNNSWTPTENYYDYQVIVSN